METKIGDIPEHPFLKKLVADRSTTVMTLRGYVGPTENAGRVRLYASLDDLSESVEINKEDILHHAATPESIQPFGSTTIWIKRDAEVVYKLDRVEKVATVKEIRAGRLKIVVPGGGLRQDDVCQSVCSVCQSVCSVCQSVCGVCQSVCSAGRGGNIGSRFRQRTRNRFR